MKLRFRQQQEGLTHIMQRLFRVPKLVLVELCQRLVGENRVVAPFQHGLQQFGCGPEVIDGAIYGKNTEAYSVDEMRALIDAFLKRPAVEGNGEA